MSGKLLKQLWALPGQSELKASSTAVHAVSEMSMPPTVTDHGHTYYYDASRQTTYQMPVIIGDRSAGLVAS